MKIFFFYLISDCNHAGVWECDWEVLQIRTGCDITVEDVKRDMAGKVVFFDKDTKLFLPSFLEFQYGGELSKTNNIYKSIEKILIKYNLFDYLTIDIVDESSNSDTIRKRVSQKKRAEIFYKNNLTCEYCQEQKVAEELVIDHFVPIIKGGGNDDDNLICSCYRCNSFKSDLDINEFLNKNHSFLKPTNKILEGAYSLLKGAKDKDKDKDMDKEQEDKGGVGEKEDELVYPFTSEKFMNAWNLLLEESYWKKKTNRALQAALKKLSTVSESVAIMAIEDSLAGSYKGIFPEKFKANNGAPKPYTEDANKFDKLTTQNFWGER